SRISPDGRLMGIAAEEFEELKLVDTATGRFRGTIQVPHGVGSFDFSPDGKILATSCADTSILLWDLDRPWNGKPDLLPPRSRQEAEVLWRRLGDVDPAAMETALWALVRGPEQTLAFFEQNLRG